MVLYTWGTPPANLSGKSLLRIRGASYSVAVKKASSFLEQLVKATAKPQHMRQTVIIFLIFIIFFLLSFIFYLLEPVRCLLLL
jgi:hypothetical protein